MDKEFHDASAMPTKSATRSNDAASEGTQSIPNVDVFKVGVRVPPFWPEEPEIWFAQVEGQFAISGITNDLTKFNYVIGHLDVEQSREIKDIIISPPSANKYDTLKRELIKRLSASREKQIKQLLMHEELGDRKPSQFLRHLKSLAGADVSQDLLKTIWTSRLSHGIQTVLAGQPSSSSIEDLADLADRVHELATPMPAVASTSQAVPGSALDALAREVAELRRQVQRLSTGRRSRPRSRSSGPARRGSTSRLRRSDSNYRKFPLCWYHAKYAEKASRCVKPCDYMAGNAKGGR
ncbi:uncharacterized protein LOC121730727 [Aricia agestis]|uniref:uncharacterized protein LOC121730727 n=1 Tax=Aricia agestis TaxID=91739 RepID=UPI001C201F14|nr:uncharacterized protein LOC121730727 [Aricia agestis]